jgi:hypothetical protein
MSAGDIAAVMQLDLPLIPDKVLTACPEYTNPFKAKVLPMCPEQDVNHVTG